MRSAGIVTMADLEHELDVLTSAVHAFAPPRLSQQQIALLLLNRQWLLYTPIPAEAQAYAAGLARMQLLAQRLDVDLEPTATPEWKNAVEGLRAHGLTAAADIMEAVGSPYLRLFREDIRMKLCSKNLSDEARRTLERVAAVLDTAHQVPS